MLKKSRQRNELLNILSVKNYHPTAEKLYIRVKEKLPNVGIASIYRNLDQLCRINMISKIDVPNKPARYDGNTEKHHHVVCETCGKMTDITFNFDIMNNSRINELLPDYKLTGYSIKLRGICGNCKKTSSTTENQNSIEIPGF